ncbi:AGE family epimerase/isomerase [Meridianimarinicoccus sp. MJW13]|uniref:AGE family epimerase/isomerase n=1 Tax=Meridianimarinicoccus sp. MJW13 TaxID=2720031 RepID=UPI001868529B|nr:AGE family epimerase/isomerase [Fluviibacterium sp. MJW13]
MTDLAPAGPADPDLFWIDTPEHRRWLRAQADAMFDFFKGVLGPEPGFRSLDYDGNPLTDAIQPLHSTTRLVHSFALGKLLGREDCDAIIDRGMDALWSGHRDTRHGGYVWGIKDQAMADPRKLAYGHVFVLLAGSSARMVGHPDADRLIADVSEVLDRHFWEETPGRLCDEYNRDWTPFSDYRGMNANMHGAEGLMAAYEATGRQIYLDRAGRIFEFFLFNRAPAHGWRIPEHYKSDWSVDLEFTGDAMFRPAGTTPGHSFEMGRLLLQYWDLTGRQDDRVPQTARKLIDTAFEDAWDAEKGGLYYTLNHDGSPRITDRYWWPVTEAIGAYAALLKLERNPQDEARYRQLWQFAASHFIDAARGGWYPEVDAQGKPDATQFKGKPDIYHALQACLFPLSPELSHIAPSLQDLPPA